METLLTGAVNRLLRKYIKSAGGEAGSELRVSLSASGSVELYNLELDLQALMGRLPFAVRRAFAHRLTVTVRWASLTIQVELDDVEILLAVDEADHSLHAQPSTLADELGAAISEEAEEAPAEGGSWWMDTFRPTLLQALANMTVVLRNVAVRCQAGGVTASLSCAMLHAASTADAKLSSRPEDEGWLTKAVELRGLCLDVQQHQPPDIAHSTPLLRTSRLQASATLPALVLLGEAASEASSPLSLDVAVDLLPLDVSLSDQQLQWMAAFAAAMPEAQPDDAVEEPAWPAQPEPATAAGSEAVTPQADSLDLQRPEGFQAFGWAAWQYLTNEEAPGAPLSAQQPADLAVSLSLKLQGGQAKLLRSGTTGSFSDTGTTGQSSAVVAALQLIGVSAEAQLLASELQYAELRLHQLTVSRPRPAPLDPPWPQPHPPNSPRPTLPPAAAARGVPAQTRSPDDLQRSAATQTEAAQEVFGLHPVRSGRQSAADMPLALWMQWQAGQSSDAAGTSPTEPASASLRIGQLHAAHIPGLLTEVQQLFVLGRAAGSKAAAAEVDAQSSSGGNGKPQEPEAAAAAPLLARWLAADLSVDLAISAAQVAAVAAADMPAEAVLLDIAKISGQLGPIKARAHSVQHSMAAALLQQVKGGPPAHGLRLALSGLRLSTASQWPLGGSAAVGPTEAAGGVDGSDSLATPASPARRQEQLPEAVSAAADLQLLMVARSSTGGAGAPAGSARAAQQAVGDSWAAWAMLSPMSLRLTALQLAAVSAAIGGLSAGPEWVLRPAGPTAAAPQPAALDVLSIDMAPLQLAYSPLGAAAVSAGLAGSGIAAASSLTVATEALEASVSCSAAAGGGRMRLACHPISAAAAPGFDLRVPVIEASFSQLPSSSSSSTTVSDAAAAAAQQQQRQGMPCRLTGFAISLDNSSRSTGGHTSASLHVAASKTAAGSSNGSPAKRLAVRLNTFSAALEPHDWCSALQFAFSLTAAPLLPPHSSYAVLEADHGSADSASEMDVRLDAALVTVHMAGGRSLQRDSISVSLASASYLQQQTAAGDSSASASVQYFDCCTHSSAAELAFSSFLRVHYPAGVQQGSQPLPMKLTSTSQGQAKAAASHTRLQLPVVELLLEPASVCCLMELLSQVPQRPPASPDPEQTAQAGRSAFQLCIEGILVRLQHDSTEEAAAADKVSCTLCTDAVELVLNRPAASGRWGVEEGRYQEVDVKAAGLTVTISAADVPPMVSLLLAPQDWDVHVESDAAAGTTAVLLRTGCLSVCASLAAAGAMLRLQAALTPPGSAEPEAHAEGTKSGAAGASAVHAQQHAQHTDDLTCGLFSLSPEVAGRPGVMQISLGDRAAGFMPWMGGGESWVCWRYSFARPVAALVLRGPAAKLPLADIELAHLDAASGEFVAVELQKAEPPGVPADALLLEIEKPVAAEEWQLSWTAEGVHARDLLAHLRVNPQPQPLPQPAGVPPLTVPLTLGLEAEAVNVAVLVPSAAAAPGWQEELGSIECGGLKAVVHKWQSGGWAMRLSCGAALRHHEHNAAVLRSLLHAPQLVLCLESGAQVHRCSSEQHSAERSAVALATLQPGRSLLVPQPEPTAPGNHVLLRFLEGPVSVRLDELSVYSLQRLATVLVAAKVIADDSTPGSDLAAEAMGNIVVENLCPDALRVQQVGSASPVTVASHSTREYQWELPPELADGAQRRIRLSGTAAPSCKLAWSHPIEVLSVGESLQRVPMSDGSVRAVAVKVSRVGVGWRMTLRPAFGLRNVSGHQLYLHFPGQHATDAGAPPPVLELQADEAAVVPVWLRDSTADQSSLLVWLGGGSGWSRPVALTPAASGNEGIELAAGGFGDTSLPSMAHLAGRSVEVAATCSIHQQCGQIVVTFLPLTRLHNSLPLAVDWRLLQQSPSDGAANPSTACGQLLPGASTPLPVRRGDARCLQFRCSPDAGGHVQAALDSAALSRGGSLEAGSWGSQSMASGTSAAGVDDSGWSSPLTMGRRQASGGSWRLLAAAAEPATATLPASGNSCLVRLPWAPHAAASAAVLPAAGNGDAHNNGKPVQQLSVSLAVEEVLQGSPMMLTLLPHGVLHNRTGSDLVLEATQGIGGWSAAAAAGTDAVIHAGDPAALPTEARLGLRLGSAVLQSWPFKLEHGCRHQLLLQHCKDGATAGYFVTLGVELRQRTSASKRAAAATPMLHVTCWETFYVSNLTSQPVQLLPLHSPDPALGPIQCGVGDTVPVSLAWPAVTSKPTAAVAAAAAAAASAKAAAATAASEAAGDAAATAPAEQHASAVTWPCTVVVQPVDPLPDGSASGDAGGNGSTASAAGSSAIVSLAEPCQRRWLSMPGPGGRLRQVAFRLLRGRGRHHLVLFEEQQPPLRLVSAASMHLWIGLSPPQQQGLGRFTYGDKVSQAFVLAPGQQHHCEVLVGDSGAAVRQGQQGQEHSSTEATIFEEDEAAFMERLAARSSAVMGPPPAVLRLRPHSGGDQGSPNEDQPWSPPCMLVPGRHVIGDWEVQICKQPGTLVATVQAACSSAQQSGVQLSALPAPLSFGVALHSLQLEVWDDERRHLSGGRLASDAGAEGSAAPAAAVLSKLMAPGQPVLTRQLGSRLFCISVDDLCLDLSRRHVNGSGGMGVQLRTHVNLTAGGLQVDSHLADAHYPVVCKWQPVTARRQGRAAALPPFLFTLEVATALGGREAPAQALSNTWVRRVRLVLPPLALAVDDALLAFGDALQRTLQTADAAAADRGGSIRQLTNGMAAAEDQEVRAELQADALTCAANRLLVEELAIGAIQLTLDVHVSEASPQRIPVDAHAVPVALPPTAAMRLWAWPATLVRGLAAHYLAEALLNAPQVLGGLDLFFNPTGLVRSITAGLGDLFGLPMAALGRGSPAGFVAGLGSGSASLLRNLSGWTLTSIAGFSGAFSRLLERSLSASQAAGAAAGGGGGPPGRPAQRRAPTTLASGLSQGLAGLYGGVSSGVAGIVSAPVQGYTDGSGLVRGLGRGLAGAVGLPVSGALAAIEAVTSGIAAATGVSPMAIAQRAVPGPDSPHLAARPSLCRLATHATEAHRLLSKAGHSGTAEASTLPVGNDSWGLQGLLACRPSAAEAEVLAVTDPETAEVVQLAAPVAMITGELLAVCDAGGSTLQLCLGLQGAQLQLDADARQIMVRSRAWKLVGRTGGDSAGDLRVMLRLADADFHPWACTLRRALA